MLRVGPSMSSVGGGALRVRRTALALAGALLLSLLPNLPVTAAGEWLSVIVRGSDGAPSAAAAVRRAGGETTLDLPIVGGVAARVRSGALDRLEADPGVFAVVPDEPVGFASLGGGAKGRKPAFSVYAHEVQANRLWAEGVDGRGVRVALVDTGVSAVPDLADRLVSVPDPSDPEGTADCVDLSGEGHCEDSYGHGTFMAGLIAGTGASSGGLYRGAAPGAEIVSIKIAGRDGSADVSKVLAAIQWVVSFKDRLGIRVLNLSLGTNSTVSYRFDPLNFAVQRAWRSGVAVVVAASNRGPSAGTISKPADDPLVITVGAVDDRETPAVSDDRLPHFSGRGPTAADGLSKPDVVAPGGRVISLRSPGSFVEEQVPGGPVDAVYRRGSGTSMSAAITSGVAALVLQANPGWTPDRLKFALMSTAHKVASRDPMGVGKGLVQAWTASRQAPDGLANGDVTVLADGTGLLDDSRGDVRVTACDASGTCDLLSGELTALGRDWDGDAFRLGDWTEAGWYASQWRPLLGSSWYGTSWHGESWFGSSWYGSSWYGGTDGTAYGRPVLGSSWYGAWE